MSDEVKTTGEKIVDVKAGRPTALADLAVENAQKIAAKVESIKSLINTPTGWVGVAGALLGIWATVQPYLAGDKKVGDLIAGAQIHVIIDKMPDLKVIDETTQPIPIPLPKPTKSLTVVVFSATPYDAEWIKSRGHAVTQHATVPPEWTAIVANAGGVPRVFVADAGGIRGSTGTEKAVVEALLKAWEK